jgi:hypothetical protein
VSIGEKPVSELRLPAISCPECAGGARIRQSRALSELVRELRYACVDVDCGHTFRAELVITHTISPSARPSPRLRLPIWPIGRGANDNEAAAAMRG